MKRIIPLLIVCVFSLSAVVEAKPKPTPTPKPNPKATPVQRHTVISNINSDAITIDTGLTTKTYKIDKHTVYFFKGERTKASELQPGMRVSVSSNDGKTAENINAGDAPKPNPAAKK